MASSTMTSILASYDLVDDDAGKNHLYHDDYNDNYGEVDNALAYDEYINLDNDDVGVVSSSSQNEGTKSCLDSDTSTYSLLIEGDVLYNMRLIIYCCHAILSHAKSNVALCKKTDDEGGDGDGIGDDSKSEEQITNSSSEQQDTGLNRFGRLVILLYQHVLVQNNPKPIFYTCIVNVLFSSIHFSCVIISPNLFLVGASEHFIVAGSVIFQHLLIAEKEGKVKDIPIGGVSRVVNIWTLVLQDFFANERFVAPLLLQDNAVMYLMKKTPLVFPESLEHFSHLFEERIEFPSFFAEGQFVEPNFFV